jgi:ferredoxin
MEIVIDRDKCMGAGQCVQAAPDVFDQHEQDGRALLLVERLDRSHLDAVRDARDTCPLGAIRIPSDQGVPSGSVVDQEAASGNAGSPVTDAAPYSVTDRRARPAARHDHGVPGQ